jgi:hypothetical protein
MSEAISQQDFHTLLETLRDLRGQNEALKKRVAFLEMILEQRVELTQSTYRERKDHFNQMQELVFKLFLQAPGQPFSYVEIQEEWRRAYPHMASSAVNVPRRVRELVQLRKLWQNIDKSDGLARFWLKLEKKKLEA